MPDRPNLLLIWTDEQRCDTLAAYGNEQVQAPNLNRLAQQSFVFDRAYCCQPVCTPSRGCIMSGLWPWQHGASENNEPLGRDVKTIAELVDPAYRRSYMGKWHLGDEISAQHGFDQWLSIEDAMYRPYYRNPADLQRRSDYHDFLWNHGFSPDQTAPDGARCFSRNLTAALPCRFTKAGFLGQRAADYLRGHDPRQPFLLSVNFLEPHMPFFGPLNDHHDPAALSVGPAFALPPAADASVRHQALAALYRSRGFGSRPLQCESDWRRLRANYYGLVSLVDQAVGNILTALDESGLADNTIVAFTSDHGEMMGDHAIVAKGVLYEEATRIPLLLRVPWLSRRLQHLPGAVSQIDLLPTLLDLMNQPLPTGLAGRSRRPVLEGRESLADNDVFFLWHGSEYNTRGVAVPGVAPDMVAAVTTQEWRSIVSHEGFKLNLCATDPNNELYDLTADPHELHNLYRDPQHQILIADLTRRIRVWQQTTGDPLPVPQHQHQPSASRRGS